MSQYVEFHLIQMCFRITRGSMFDGELYAQRFQRLIYMLIFIVS